MSTLLDRVPSPTHVVVITGASSGLGRATAIQFAKHGSAVVLAARRRDALEETARACRLHGTPALVAVTDVTVEEDVNALTRAALSQFGHIDVWVNNAGVTLFAPLDAADFAEHKRVIETNLFGAMLCARSAIPVFRRQGKGTLINVGSILSKVGNPFVPSYTISKFGLRGLSEVLRTAVADRRDIHVCTVLPHAIDTQHFETGANRIGQEVRALPPLQSPEKVARAIFVLVRRPRRERHIPRTALLGVALHALAPRTIERILLGVLRRWHFSTEQERAATKALFAPSRGTPQVRGTRPPQLSMPQLLGWIARHLISVLRWSERDSPSRAPHP